MWITSHRLLQVHLRGYALDPEVINPGEGLRETELSFDATNTGRFAIENEQTHEELGVLIVHPG